MNTYLDGGFGLLELGGHVELCLAPFCLTALSVVVKLPLAGLLLLRIRHEFWHLFFNNSRIVNNLTLKAPT